MLIVLIMLIAFGVGFVLLPVAAVWLLTRALSRGFGVASTSARVALGVLLFLAVFVGIVGPAAKGMADDDSCVAADFPVPEGTDISSTPSLWPPGKTCRYVKPNGEVTTVGPGYGGFALVLLLMLDGAVIPLAVMESRHQHRRRFPVSENAPRL